MTEFLGMFLAIAILIAIVVMFAGFLGALFWRGRRKRSLKLSGFAFLAVIVAAILMPLDTEEDKQAKEMGFINAADLEEAQSYDISSPEVWKSQKLDLRAERAAAEESERQEQERIVAEQKAEADRIEAERKAEAERVEREAEEAEAAEFKSKGFHCLSQWDGSHAEFKYYVTERMRNPNSFEHIETRVGPVDDQGRHALIMKYRAENGFGGMNIGIALGSYSNETCDFELISLE